MGFGNVASQMIMFIAIITITSSLVMVFNSYVADASSTMKVKKDAMVDKLNTEFEIVNVNHDYTNNITTIYVLNTGKTSIDFSYLDVFIDTDFLDRDTMNKTVQASTNIKNPTLWDPKEILQINASMVLADNETHVADVVISNGLKDTEMFS